MFGMSAFGLAVHVFIAVMFGHDHGSHRHEHSNGHSDEDRHEQAYGQEHEHSQENEYGHDHDHNHDQEHVHVHVHDVNTNKDVKELLSNRGNKKSFFSWLKKSKMMSINMESAYLHVLGDILLNIGGMIAGGLIWYKPEWKIIDLACTLIFSVVVIGTTIKMMRKWDILGVLMESTPREIDATQLENGLCALDGVIEIHELHIWAITREKVLLTCHVIIAPDADYKIIRDQVIEYIKREYSISHVNIQIEEMNC